MKRQPMQEILVNPPKSKEYLESGIVVVREEMTYTIVDKHTNIYKWLESRYTQADYMKIIEQEKDLLKYKNNELEIQKSQLWDTVDYLLKATGCVPPINGNIVDTIQ